VNKVGNDGADAVQAFEEAPRDGYTMMLFLDFYASGFARESEKPIQPGTGYLYS